MKFDLRNLNQVRVGDVIAKPNGFMPLTVTRVIGVAHHKSDHYIDPGLPYGIAVEVAERGTDQSTVLWFGEHAYIHRAAWCVCAGCECLVEGIDYLCTECRDR